MPESYRPAQPSPKAGSSAPAAATATHDGGPSRLAAPSGAAAARTPDQTRSSPAPGLVKTALLPIGVFFLVVVLGLGGVFGFRAVAEPPPPPTVAPADELTRPAPPGWLSTYAWNQEISPTSDLAVADNRVATINANGALVVLDADNGDLVWASDPNVISPLAKPVIADAGGVPVAGIHDSDQGKLYLTRLDQGEAGDSGRLSDRLLPDGAAVTWTGGSLLVTADTRTWVVSADLGLQQIDLADGDVAMAADGETVVAGPAEGPWSVFEDGDSRQVEPEQPDAIEGEPHPSYSASGVILVWWDTADEESKIASLHDVETGELLADVEIGEAELSQASSLSVSANGAQASAGPILANLETGEAMVDPEWSATAADNRDQLYGIAGEDPASWDGQQVSRLVAGTAIPWGTSDHGYAVVLDRTAEGATVVGGLTPQ